VSYKYEPKKNMPLKNSTNNIDTEKKKYKKQIIFKDSTIPPLPILRLRLLPIRLPQRP
jgi:hypothetical protein